MLTADFIQKVEVFREELERLSLKLRERYGKQGSQVQSKEIRDEFIRLADQWLTGFSTDSDLASLVERETIADIAVACQRLLAIAEKATIRRKYDAEVRAILENFRARVVIPLKVGLQNPGGVAVAARAAASAGKSIGTARSIFLAHSFHDDDREVADAVRRLLEALQLKVITGEKPRAGSVSAKVKARIEKADAFVGLLTRRSKIEGKNEWTTSAWLIEEKTYALGLGKEVVLLREDGIADIGGLQSDDEYLPFSRGQLGELLIDIVEVFCSEE